MSEFLKSLTSEQWFITIVTFLAANFGTILIMAVTLIKNKVKSNQLASSVEEALSKKGIQLNEENLAKLSEMNTSIEAKLNQMEEALLLKLKLDTEDKKAKVEESTLKVQDLINEALKGITNDETKEGE